MSILTTSPGQRHALLPNPRSRRAPFKQAERCTTESEQLRGRPRFPSRASDRECQTFDVPHQHPTTLPTTTPAVILIYERPLTSLPFRQWKSPQREFTTGTFPRSAKRRRKQEEAAKKFPFFQPSDARRSKKPQNRERYI
jgi:hypothetical protein